VIANLGSRAVALPAGNIIATSEPLPGRVLPVDTAAWLWSTAV
jgi:hypothetical protein